MEEFQGTNTVAMLDLLQGYWQCPLAEEALETFIITVLTGLFIPTRVLHEVLNSMTYIQVIK